MPIVRRFALPLFLLIGCLAAFVASERLGTKDQAVGSGRPIDSLAVPLASIRRLPELATASLNTSTLAAAIPEAPPGLTRLSCLTIMIDGEVVHDLRGDASLVPGYAQLLLTGHVALDVLGPDFRYRTTVMAGELPDENGWVDGDLFLVGGGDPVLMTFNYSRGFRPILGTRTSIEELAQGVADAGVELVNGGLVGVERRYDIQRTLPGWPTSYSDAGIAGPLSALQLDDGFAERAAANAGIAVAAEEPALHAAERFHRLLDEVEVNVPGPASHLDDEEEVPDLVPVASIDSPPLSEIVFQMLAVNDASAAEMILKEIGLAYSQDGSTKAGGDAVQRVLTEQGVALEVPPRDGSGLDPVSTLSCRQLALLAETIPDDHPTMDVLPAFDLPGVFGGELADIDLQADLRLIGGSIGDASGLVGRTLNSDRRVVIASIVNRAGGPRITDVRFQRQAIAAIDSLLVSTDPSVIEASPAGE